MVSGVPSKVTSRHLSSTTMDLSEIIEDIILKFIKEFQETTKNSKQSWKRTKVEDLHTLISKFARKLLHTNQDSVEPPWGQIHKRMENTREPETHHHVYDQMIFNNDANTFQW